MKQKTDDEDSGNDEPVDLPIDYKDFGFSCQNPQSHSPNFELPHRTEARMFAVPSSKIDRLAEQLSLLSTPRLYDSLTSTVNSLPPESKSKHSSHIISDLH